MIHGRWPLQIILAENPFLLFILLPEPPSPQQLLLLIELHQDLSAIMPHCMNCSAPLPDDVQLINIAFHDTTTDPNLDRDLYWASPIRIPKRGRTT